ncbi:MAG: DNA mismatch repair protein MutS, partial [Rhodospirillaceae bacterium]|nr:DNA mismatch repair protein MutS [Rhodospirillaceae bacterium]
MLRQYREAKAAHPDCLLFFRMGDFYEMFFEDAKVAAAALDIALTKRGQADGVDIPMAGVPAHSHEGYLQRLIRQGHRVAICEQVEDPAEARKRPGKTIVRREVVRVATPGTMTEDTLLDARAHNYLAAVAEVAGLLGLAAVDISTGDLVAEAVERPGLASALARLGPAELLISDRLADGLGEAELIGDWRDRITVLPHPRFDADAGAARVEALFGVATLAGFGAFSRAEAAALGALVDYIDLTQKGRMPRLAPPRRQADGAILEVDTATRRNLELTRTLTGERAGSLLATIDRTVTGAGARRLAAWLSAPLTDPAAIDRRLDGVQFLAGDEGLRGDLRTALRGAPDLERALSRLSLGRGGPRDLAAVRDGLAVAQQVSGLLARPSLAPPPELVAAAHGDLGEHARLIDRLAAALAAELPLAARDGGFIAAGFAPALDEQRALRDEGRRMVAALQARYAADTGIASLKVKHNNVLGFHVEVTPAHADKLAASPHGDIFVHRQTLASSVRFGTVELAELERRMAEAGDRALALELELFAELVAQVTGEADGVALAASALSLLDVAAGLADLAVDRAWCRPVVTDDASFEVKGGRHPVVEAALQAAGAAPFVANDCDLSPGRRLWLLTGPNMAGKSTFLRQNALIALIAQMGSYVPAAAARIGVVDRLFSRVGAADDLARGRSTFMVEMVETATILNQASERSLVILDEI